MAGCFHAEMRKRLWRLCAGFACLVCLMRAVFFCFRWCFCGVAGGLLLFFFSGWFCDLGGDFLFFISSMFYFSFNLHMIVYRRVWSPAIS